MQNFVNIGEIRRRNILKGFVNIGESEDIEKAKSGVYADNAENQKLNRVGQKYGSKKQEDPKGDKSPAKKEDEAPEDSKPSLEDHAKGTDSEVLKKVVANEKSDPALVAAAKRELTARGETHAHNTPEEKEDGSGSDVKGAIKGFWDDVFSEYDNDHESVKEIINDEEEMSDLLNSYWDEEKGGDVREVWENVIKEGRKRIREAAKAWKQRNKKESKE